MEKDILQKDDPILRLTAKSVEVEDITSRKIQTIIRRMQKALESQDDGVAIAAPQIGESLRIFVVSKRVFDILEEENRTNNEDEIGSKNNKDMGKTKDLVFINPVIIKQSKKKIMLEEGCLSVRWLYGLVQRSEKTTVRAYDEMGKIFTFGGSGIMSQIFQHETDHLDGVLFIDKAKNLKDIPPE